MPTLLDALDNPAFFGELFPTPSWTAWRSFCAALYGLDMPAAQLDVFRRCTGRQDTPTRPASEAWVVCGRRSGKSRIAAAVATYTAALAPTTTLAPREWGTVLVCAVDKAQARVVFNYCKALFALPALRPLVEGETAESIELRHRVRLEVRASNFRGVRGVTLLAAVLDEVAFLREEGSALPDVELYRALKPALATTGGLILGISSPWAQRGLLWQKYRRHFGQDGDVLIWQADSRASRPDRTPPRRARRLFCPFVFHGALCAPGRVHSKAYGCVGHFETAWATACRTAGFPVGRRHGGFVFHNTRHTAVTNLVNAGVPTHEAMTVSGHRTRSVFDRYSLSLKQQTKAALRRVTEYTQQQDPTPTVIPVQRQGQRGDDATVSAPAVPWPSAS